MNSGTINDNWGAVILAAGRGARMGDGEQKVLKEIDGSPIICWTINTLKTISIKEIIIVVGHQESEVKKQLCDYDVVFATQVELLGTANAARVGLEKLNSKVDYVMILFGDDSALFSSHTLQSFMDSFVESKRKGMLLVTKLGAPTPLGGLRRDERGNLVGVMFRSQLIAQGLGEHEILCGAMCFDRQWLQANIDNITPSKLTGEYPLPGIIEVAARAGEYLDTFLLPNPKEWASVNTQDELEIARSLRSELK